MPVCGPHTRPHSLLELILKGFFWGALGEEEKEALALVLLVTTIISGLGAAVGGHFRGENDEESDIR